MLFLVIWHIIFRVYWHGDGGQEALLQSSAEVEVGLEKRVETYVCTKPWPIISVNEMGVIPVEDVNIPTHIKHIW
jgi:hypothetical protein